jgi:hypothetical protein
MAKLNRVYSISVKGMPSMTCLLIINKPDAKDSCAQESHEPSFGRERLASAVRPEASDISGQNQPIVDRHFFAIQTDRKLSSKRNNMDKNIRKRRSCRFLLCRKNYITLDRDVGGLITHSLRFGFNSRMKPIYKTRDKPL